MNILKPGFLVGLILACHSGAPPDSAPPGSVALSLQHATLISPGENPIPNASVTVDQGRILCAGTATACPRPSGSRVVDLSGTWLGPGLIDAHVHYSQTGWVDGRPDAVDLRTQYPYDSVSRALGYGPVVAVDPSRAGAADVSFAAPYIPMAIDALGLAGWDDHSDKETADLRWLPKLTKRAAVLIYRLGTRESGMPKS